MKIHIENHFIYTFSGLDLPKEEDFFQFQYLRVSEDASQTVLGASIPFQLRKPKNEELCTVQVLTLLRNCRNIYTYIYIIKNG